MRKNKNQQEGSERRTGARSPEGPRHPRQFREVIWLCILLIVAHGSLEWGALLEKLYPDIANIYVHPFLDKDYVFPVIAGQPEGILLKWWIYYSANNFFDVLIFFVLCKLAKSYSYRLYRVSVLYLLYHIVDHFMLWYNYRSSAWVYYLMNIAIVLSIISMFIKEKKTAVIKQMK